ncbi:MAG: hypothetical protein KDK37_16875 [Leptospiraceae bacterium]|nr:hypothetical protein [Leptospiraceae bacterium]MCB1305966.1 hypothetical protein [Leptospiraceae bacterium]
MATATVTQEKAEEVSLRKVLLRLRRENHSVDEKTGIRYQCDCRSGECNDRRCIRGLV